MKSVNNDFWLKKLFYSNLFFLLILMFLVIISISLFQEIMKKVEIQKEIKKLEHKVYEYESRNTELSLLIEYLKTDEYLEKEAKTKLGYKKPGETVVAITTKSNSNNGTYSSSSTTDKYFKKSNWQLWLDYFFN